MAYHTIPNLPASFSKSSMETWLHTQSKGLHLVCRWQQAKCSLLTLHTPSQARTHTSGFALRSAVMIKPLPNGAAALARFSPRPSGVDRSSPCGIIMLPDGAPGCAASRTAGAGGPPPVALVVLGSSFPGHNARCKQSESISPGRPPRAGPFGAAWPAALASAPGATQTAGPRAGPGDPPKRAGRPGRRPPDSNPARPRRPPSRRRAALGVSRPAMAPHPSRPPGPPPVPSPTRARKRACSRAYAHLKAVHICTGG
jgi:hypothetical protein